MAPRIALLDTNLLLLRLAGGVDPTLLETFKRVTMFTVEDLNILAGLLKPFDNVITTPHVLTESSNLLNHAPPYRRMELVAALRDFIRGCEEVYEKATLLTSRAEFDSFGLADSGLASLSKRATVITTDFPLAGLIESQDGNVINFNHHRGLL